MRGLHGALLAVSLAVAAASGADPPAVSGDAKIDAGKMARIAVTNLPPKAAVILDVVPETVDTEELPGGKFLLTGLPGEYRLKVRVIEVTDSGVKVTTLRWAVTVTGGPTPPQPPGPGPQPAPDPGPVTPTKLWGVVVVEETAAAVADRGRLFTDPALSALMAAKGYRFRVVDKDVAGADGQPPADLKRFLDASSGKPYPQAFVVDAGGKVVWSGDLPKDPAGLADTLRKWGGP